MMSETESPLQPRGAGYPLRSSALWATWEHVLGLVAVFLFALRLWPFEVALQWILQALAVLSFVHSQLRRHLGENHFPGCSQPVPSLGVANRITLARGWGISCLAGLTFLPEAAIYREPAWISYAPGLLYLTIGCADFFDGLWARRTGTESALGKRLDVEMDALGLLAASCLGVWLGRLPLFYLMVGASYYVFRFGIWTRLQGGRIVLPLKDRPTARIMAGLNMGFLGTALLPLFAPAVLKLTAVCFSVPLLLGFLWDWLVVIGSLTEDRADRMQRLLGTTAEFLGLMMRVVVLVVGPIIAGTLVQSPAATAAVAEALLWVMIVLGWMGRTASLVASCWLAHGASSGHWEPLVLVTLSAVLVLTILGTGYWSLWKPEDACLTRRAGTRPTLKEN
jgi:phosphatidylglycerophosphate synthase